MEEVEALPEEEVQRGRPRMCWLCYSRRGYGGLRRQQVVWNEQAEKRRCERRDARPFLAC